MELVKRKKKHIDFRFDLNSNSLVAVKYSPGIVVLMYPEEWDKVSNTVPCADKLRLSYLSREFRVNDNSINLDGEFHEYLGKGHIKARRYSKGIILETHGPVKLVA